MLDIIIPILIFMSGFLLGFSKGKGDAMMAEFFRKDSKYWFDMWVDADKRATKYFNLLTNHKK